MTFGRVKSAFETLSTVFVMAAALALLWTVFVKQQPEAAKAPPAVEDVAGTIAAPYLTNMRGAGEIAIVEFTDFQCPFCAKHATETLPALTKAINGKARYITVNLPLAMHAQAIHAAEAAECAAEQGKYWQMHDLLFARQKELGSFDYVSLSQDAGVDARQFGACLKAEKALARVTAHQKEAERLRVTSTPTLFVGRMRSDGGIDLLRRVNGALPVDTFVAEVAKVATISKAL